ncbi:hypothetical protein [Rhizobium leguminosarum]|uniref:hypothetical protein n=1 Tax=Rhizobium leguminosarum TaxID=384 RepID=UPI001FE00C01|nr:hypothetical protein [Rhizobium leguminosarum]
MTMLIASMDHSPQEIPNHRDVWHTSALLVSVSAEQWGWGETLGPLLNPQRKKLRKWAARRADRYRSEFRRQFPMVLAGSSVFALGLSVQGGTIIDSLPELIAQMGLDQNLRVSGQQVTIVGLASGPNFTISTVQAASVIYLMHFICRMHALIRDELRDGEGAQFVSCDWQISPDNFPLGVDGPMAALFSIAANSAANLRLVSGNLRVLTHYLHGDPGVDVCVSGNVKG